MLREIRQCMHSITATFSCSFRFVCRIIDLLIPGTTPHIKELLVDLYGKPELLFFGLDGM